MAHESSKRFLFALTLGLALLFEGCGSGWSVGEQTEASGDGVLEHWTDLHGAVTGQPDDDLRAWAQPNLGTQPRGDDDLALGRRLDNVHDGSLCQTFNVSPESITRLSMPKVSAPTLPGSTARGRRASRFRGRLKSLVEHRACRVGPGHFRQRRTSVEQSLATRHHLDRRTQLLF
jgi:hypothetical protein